MEKEPKTPQEVLDQAREEFEKKFCIVGASGAEYWRVKGATTEITLIKEILSWHTSTLQSFIEAEIEHKKGMNIKRNTNGCYLKGDDGNTYILNCEYGNCEHSGYNKALSDQISHLKELLVTLKR